MSNHWYSQLVFTIGIHHWYSLVLFTILCLNHVSRGCVICDRLNIYTKSKNSSSATLGKVWQKTIGARGFPQDIELMLADIILVRFS